MCNSARLHYVTGKVQGLPWNVVEETFPGGVITHTFFVFCFILFYIFPQPPHLLGLKLKTKLNRRHTYSYPDLWVVHVMVIMIVFVRQFDGIGSLLY